MFLHSKTISNRLHKVEQLLAIDFNNAIQMANYEIGAYVIKMRQSALEKKE